MGLFAILVVHKLNTLDLVVLSDSHTIDHTVREDNMISDMNYRSDTNCWEIRWYQTRTMALTPIVWKSQVGIKHEQSLYYQLLGNQRWLVSDTNDRSVAIWWVNYFPRFNYGSRVFNTNNHFNTSHWVTNLLALTIFLLVRNKKIHEQSLISNVNNNNHDTQKLFNNNRSNVGQTLSTHNHKRILVTYISAQLQIFHAPNFWISLLLASGLKGSSNLNCSLLLWSSDLKPSDSSATPCSLDLRISKLLDLYPKTIIYSFLAYPKKNMHLLDFLLSFSN